MNLDFNPSIVTNFVRGLGSELRDKRLWPIPLVLLAALVAVPLLLTQSSSGTPVAQSPQPIPSPPSGTAIPALSVQSTPAHSRLSGSAHDPFTQQGGATTGLATAASSAVTSAPSASNTAAAAVGAGGGTSAVGSTPTSPSSVSVPTSPAGNPPSITPGAKPKPAPSGLTSTQAYDVSLSMTNSAGGVSPIDPLERLSPIPSAQQPLLIEFGVLQGGNRVLFAVQPGTVVNGPGTCTPGPIDCEILSLGRDQTESVSAQGPAGLSEVALFAITGITATDYLSAAAANRARNAESAAGAALLSKSTLPALSLFQYEPSLGSVVDLRNLTVGDS